MYGQALVQARMDSQLKDSVAAIYDALGIDLSTAIRMFFKKTLMVGGIPFEMVLPASNLKRKSFNDLFEAAREQVVSSGMTEKDVAEEIAAYRRERRKSRKTARR